MSIFDSPTESEDEQQITTHDDYYYNTHLVIDNVSPWVLIFLYFLLMSLALYALFDHQYQLYNINVNNKTENSFNRHNISDSLI